MTLDPKLAAWQSAVPGRTVTTRPQARSGQREHVCECTEGDRVVVLGVGASPGAARADARAKLWRLALEATGAATNPAPKWTR